MKHACQGPHCHTYSTKDRFIKKLKRLKGRNAYLNTTQEYRGPFTIFCTTRCQNDWIMANVDNIVNQRPITFNRERKLSQQTYRLSANNWLMRDEDRVDNE